MKFSKNLFFIIAVDMLLLAGSLLAANLVRFDFSMNHEEWMHLKKILPIALVIKLAILYFFDLYRGMWRFTSIADLLNIIKASTLSSLIIVFVILFGPTRFHGVSRSIFIIDWGFTILLIAGFRLSVRVYFVHLSEKDSIIYAIRKFGELLIKRSKGSKNLIIIGAGNCGEKIYREIRDNTDLKFNIVGFLDDDINKIGKKIHGVPILSIIKDIAGAAKSVRADEALIAIPSANSQQMRKVVALCKASGIEFKTVPGMGELIDGKVTVKAIRDVAYRDLLGREIVKLDEKHIESYLKGQNVLVTGAGGSIGSELCRQICRFEPQNLILYERAESPLFDIDLELKRQFPKTKIIPLLADILDMKQLMKSFERFNPKTVFHAAAYKHVPMLELQPWKAIENNIKGTINLIETANRFNTERFVFVSTDKAVRPTNVMGASKRIAEILVQNMNEGSQPYNKFMIVRFGNVVGSVGSVIPLFKKQIEQGGPVTVTHPDVTRYFMTIPEACQLILQTGAMGEGGEFFLLEMGDPVKIVDMARDLIRFSGFEPDKDIKIEFIGLRPGEKMFEELITQGEGIVKTEHKKILVLKNSNTCRVEESDQCPDTGINDISKQIDELMSLGKKYKAEEIRKKLSTILPEYTISEN